MRGIIRVSMAVAAACGLGAATSAAISDQSSVPAATTMVYFYPPATLPDRAVDGICRTPSSSSSRGDAWACVVGSTTHDPCFKIGTKPQVWCAADPRDPASGTLVNVTGLTVTHATPPTHRAWFFELTDGSTCRPVAEYGRTVEDQRELYTCKYGSAGEADAVLGDLDSSTPVWTIHKVLINKKAQPQTIKSLTVASVRTVWQ